MFRAFAILFQDKFALNKYLIFVVRLYFSPAVSPIQMIPNLDQIILCPSAKPILPHIFTFDNYLFKKMFLVLYKCFNDEQLIWSTSTSQSTFFRERKHKQINSKVICHDLTEGQWVEAVSDTYSFIILLRRTRGYQKFVH